MNIISNDNAGIELNENINLFISCEFDGVLTVNEITDESIGGRSDDNES